MGSYISRRFFRELLGFQMTTDLAFICAKLYLLQNEFSHKPNNLMAFFARDKMCTINDDNAIERLRKDF